MTGVQTCALPIYHQQQQQQQQSIQSPTQIPQNIITVMKKQSNTKKHKQLNQKNKGENTKLQKIKQETEQHTFNAKRSPRSEERRVGKECRSRWTTYQ